FQLLLDVTQLPLYALLVLNVGTGAVPADDGARGIANRMGPSQMPAIVSRLRYPEPVLDFTRLSGSHCPEPGIPSLFLVLGMGHREPALIQNHRVRGAG